MDNKNAKSKAALADYIANGRAFIATAKSISKADLMKSPIAGEWSAAFVLHHMADGELHFATRFLNNLAENNPDIFPFNEDIYPDRINYAKRDPLASLAAIEGVHQVISDVLTNIPDQDWKRTSVHIERGQMTLTDIVETVSGHSKAHEGQLKSIIGAL